MSKDKNNKEFKFSNHIEYGNNNNNNNNNNKDSKKRKRQVRQEYEQESKYDTEGRDKYKSSRERSNEQYINELKRESGYEDVNKHNEANRTYDNYSGYTDNNERGSRNSEEKSRNREGRNSNDSYSSNTGNTTNNSTSSSKGNNIVKGNKNTKTNKLDSRLDKLDREGYTEDRTIIGDRNYDTELGKVRDEVGSKIMDISDMDDKDVYRDFNQREEISQRELRKLEKKKQREKADRIKGTLKNARDRISKGNKEKSKNKNVSDKEKKKDKGKFKAFMDSKEVKSALNYVWRYGGLYGKAFVIIVKFLNFFGILGFLVTGALLVVMSVIVVTILMTGAVVIMLVGGEDTGSIGDDNVDTGEEKTSASVDVPKGYEGKMMYPLTKTLISTRGMNTNHKGLDLAGTEETVYPIYPGKVIMSAKGHAQAPNNGNGSHTSGSNNPSKGLYFTGDGNSVQIVHDLGNGKYIISYYMHLKPNSIKVDVGDSVGYGTVIGTMGNSGNSTGTHLHLEIYDNVDKEFYTKGQSHYKSSYNWYNILTSKIIAPGPLITCGGKSGVVKNNPGYHTFPKSCVDDAKKARTKK